MIFKNRKKPWLRAGLLTPPLTHSCWPTPGPTAHRVRLVGMKFGHRSCTFDHLLQRVQRCHQTSPSHGNLGTYEGVYAPQLPPGCTQSRGVYAEKDNFNGFF